MAEEIIELEVKSNIGSVSKDMDKLADNTARAADEQKTLNKSTGLASQGFRRLRTMVLAFGAALKAIGIGLLISGFVTLKEALGRNQKVMNTVNTIMTTVSTTFNQVANVLVDVYKWVTKSSDRFDSLGKVMKGVMNLALTPFKLAFYEIKIAVQGAMLAWEKSPFGSGDTKKIAELTVGIHNTKGAIVETLEATVEAGKAIFNNFSDAIGEIGDIAEVAIDGISKINVKANYEQAKATTAAQNSSKLAEAAIQGLIEKNDLLAETQRQIRDDETKTFADRIAANEQLGEVLKKQKIDMMKLADTRVASAALELAANKDNVDLQVAYQQTLNDRAGVEAQIAGFMSEQLTNQVSLEKELAETKRELMLSGLEGMALELAELQTAYDLKIEMARKAGEDTTAITEKFEKDQAAIKKKYEKEKQTWAKMSAEAQLDIMSQTAGNMVKILGEETAAGKAMAVTQATIDTYKGATAAYSAMAGIPVVGPALGAIAAGAAVASGLANVKAILSADASGGGGGSAPSSAGATAQAPAPEMLSGKFELGGGVEPEPLKAFVVTDEMTNSQNQLANIRRRATI